MKPLYEVLSNLIVARLNCIKQGNNEWENNHTNKIKHIIREYMPSGYGVDSGTTLNWEDSNEKKIVLTAAYHHMNCDGYYNGWTQHSIIVTPAFSGINIKVTGQNPNYIKDYLGDIYHDAMIQKI